MTDAVSDEPEVEIPSPDESVLERLHGRLVAQAGRAGLVDVSYRTVDAPIGPLLVAATDQGLVRVAFEGEGEDAVLTELAERISPRVVRAGSRLDEVARELHEYFAGVRQTFGLRLDWQLAHGFRLTVLEHLAVDVDYGHTASYGALAALAGSPRAVRAVGTACATNPLPVVVPCHRVVHADGRLGRYRGGEEAKRELLVLEGAA